MTTNSVPATNPVAGTSLLHWQLQRGNEALTCEIRSSMHRGFDVQVMLAWTTAPALIEHFDTSIAAVERHADITATLMDAGWVVTEHTHGDTPLAA